MLNRTETEDHIDFLFKIPDTPGNGIIDPVAPLPEGSMIFLTGFNRKTGFRQTPDVIQETPGGAADIRYNPVANRMRPENIQIAKLMNIVFFPKSGGI